jgi:TonB family protein
MKITLSLIVILFATSLYAQTNQKINHHWGMREAYSVSKTDTNVKEGPYVSFLVTANFDSLIVSSGFYKNNLKDSLWEYYAYKTLAQTGAYKDDKRVGVWTVYNKDNTVQLKYDYSKKKLLFYQPTARDSDIFKIYKGDSIRMATLQQPPIYLDGDLMLNKVIINNLHYPASAKENAIQGNIIVSFRINSDGHVSNFKIVKHLQDDCDKEALRVMQMVPEHWLPGYINGEAVSVEYAVPVRFEFRN